VNREFFKSLRAAAFSVLAQAARSTYSARLAVLSLLALFFLCSPARASWISFSHTNSDGTPNTNQFLVRAVGNPAVDVFGNVTGTIGIPARITPAADGRATNWFEQNNYLVTNTPSSPALFLGRGYIFRAPLDSGPTVYPAAGPGMLISGLNYFVNLTFGSNQTSVTYNIVTNALGGAPILSTNLPVLTNGFIRSLDATNISAATSLIYSNTLYSDYTTRIAVLSALSITNIYPTNAAGVTWAAGRAYVSTNYDAPGAALAIGLQATNYTIGTSNALFALHSLSITNLFPTNTAGVTYAGGRGYVSTNYDAPGAALAIGLQATNYAKSITNGYSPLVFTNVAQVLYTNALPGLTNGFVDKSITNNAATRAELISATNGITGGGISAASATNISAAQVLLGTNAIGISSGLSAFVSTNRFEIGGAALAIGAADTNFSRSIGLQATNFTIATSNALSSQTVTASNALQSVKADATNGLFIGGKITNSTIGGNSRIALSTNNADGTIPFFSHYDGAGNDSFIIEHGTTTFGVGVTNAATGWQSLIVGSLAPVATEMDFFQAGSPTALFNFFIGTTNSQANVAIISSNGIQSGNIRAMNAFFGNGYGVNNTSASNLQAQALGQVTNVVNALATISGISAATGTNIASSLIGLSNAPIAASNALLFVAKIDSTNGFATGLTSTNTELQGDVSMGKDGGSAVFYGRTNYIAFNGAGSGVITNGVYIWNATLNVYTNWYTHSILTNNSSAWLAQTNGVSLYSLSGANPIGTWSTVSGAAPLPTSVYTAAEFHILHLGETALTNITALIAAASNGVAAQFTNGSSSGSIAVVNGFGTNTTLNFASAAWGSGNSVGSASFAAAFGGTSNSASSPYSTVVGGKQNSASGGSGYNFVGGGNNNIISAGAGVIGGGEYNFIDLNNNDSVIVGGYSNRISNNQSVSSVIAGGFYNLITAPGGPRADYGFIGGGYSNRIYASYDVALGHNATVTNDHAFVFSDGTPFTSSTNSEFDVVAANGLKIYVGGLQLTNLNPGAATMALGVTSTGQVTTNSVPGGGSGPGSGTVTSVSATAPSGYSVSGVPITTAGAINISRSGDVNNLGFAETNISNLQASGLTQLGGQVGMNALIVTNGITNTTLVAATLLQADGNKKIASMANGTGFLTNNGSGNFGYLATIDGANLSGVVTRSLYDVKSFGAVGNGTADDTAAFTNAVYAADQAGGGIVYVPAGLFKLTATINIQNSTIWIIGAGPAAKIAPSGNFDVFRFSGNTRGCGVSKLFLNGTNQTGGNWFTVTNSHRITFRDLTAEKPYQGFSIESCNTCTIDNVWMDQVQGAWFCKWFGDDANRSDILQFNNVTASGGTTNTDGVIWDGNCNSMDINNLGLVTFNYGLRILKTSGANDPAFLFAQGLQIDFPNREGVKIERGTRYNLVNSYIHGSTLEYGVFVTNGVDHFTFQGGNVTGNKKGGLHIQSTGSKIIGVEIYNNSQAGTGTYPGILFTNGAIGEVVGNRVSSNHQYGLRIESSTRPVVAGNDFSGNVTGDIFDAGHTMISDAIFLQRPYWADTNVYVSSRASSISTLAVAQNKLYLMPIWVTEVRTFSLISLGMVSTLGAGSTVRLGVYGCDRYTGHPTTLIMDCGTVSTATTGTKYLPCAVTLNPGMYYVACVFTGLPTVHATLAEGLGVLMSNGVSDVGGLSRSFTFGAFPADETSQTYTTETTFTPAVGIR
jgi:hypothetical protein